MDNNLKNKFSKIINSSEDITIQRYNIFNSSFENEKNIIKSPHENNLNNNTLSQTKLSILDKTSKLFNIKLDIDRENEERKNIELDTYKNMKRKTFSFNNEYFNLNYDNNKMNNIKPNYYYQYKKTVNNINKIDDNNGMLKSKLNYDSYLSSQNSKIKNNEKNKERFIDDYSIKNGKKTILNYKDGSQKQNGGNDKYLTNINFFKQKIGNNKNRKINKNDNKNKYIINFSMGKNNLNLNNYQKGNFNTINNIKKDEYQLGKNNNFNILNKLVDNKDFNFNYRNDESFNKINKRGIQNNYKKELKINDISEIKLDLNSNNKFNNIYNNYLKSNNDNKIKYNFLNNTDGKIKNNDLFNNNENSMLDTSYIAEKERQIKREIENEEKN